MVMEITIIKGSVMKTILITMGLTVVLFLYGYALSTTGHDHDQHEEPRSGEEHSAAHSDHDH